MARNFSSSVELISTKWLGANRCTRAPLSRARRLKAEDLFDPRLERPGGDRHRLGDDLVVPVEVAVEMRVDELWTGLVHLLFQRRDQVSQGEGLEMLIGKPEEFDRGESDDLGRLSGVIRQANLAPLVANALALADDQRVDGVAIQGVAPKSAAWTENLVVGMRGNHED